MAFLLDDILLSPVKFLRFIAKSLGEEAMKEVLDEDGARKELREIYSLLESSKISEAEFDRRESDLIDRLERIEAYKGRKST